MLVRRKWSLAGKLISVGRYVTPLIDVLLLGSIATTVFVYWNRDRLDATFRPQDAAYLYPGYWSVLGLRHDGNGAVRFQIGSFRYGDSLNYVSMERAEEDQPQQ